MDFSGFGGLGGAGMLGGISRLLNPPGSGNAAAPAPAIPSDGAMQPTIGPGMPTAAPAAPAYTPSLGLPKGGLLALMQGQAKPNGIMGLLQNKFPGLLGGGPLSGGMPSAGMLPGTPGAAAEGPVAPQAPGLPMDITRDNQF